MGKNTLAGIGLAALVSVLGCDKVETSPPQKPVVQPLSRNETPVSNPITDMDTLMRIGYCVNLIPSETGKNYNGVELKTSPEWQRKFMMYDQIFCEVKRANYVSGNLKNVYQKNLLFKGAVSLNGAEIEFYGTSSQGKVFLYALNMKTRD